MPPAAKQSSSGCDVMPAPVASGSSGSTVIGAMLMSAVAPTASTSGRMYHSLGASAFSAAFLGAPCASAEGAAARRSAHAVADNRMAHESQRGGSIDAISASLSANEVHNVVCAARTMAAPRRRRCSCRRWLPACVAAAVLWAAAAQYARLMLKISEHDGRIAAELRPPPPHPPLPPPPPKSSPRASTSARYAALASAVSRDGLTGLNSTLGARDDLLLTFGSVSLASFVTNWVESLRGAGEWRLLVGALDDELLAQISGAGAPAVRIGGGEVGGGAYFRKDYEVFKKMGARKVGFLAALADAAPAGIWVCDADMVWLRPPPAELVHRAALGGRRRPALDRLPRFARR